jgi:EAL domain-containing protein (putative c-di-GMP-specific phosphodiesterase class I)
LLKLLNEPHTVNGISLVCSASIGISLFGMESHAIEMMQHADLAMYEAKKQGGNALRFFDPVMQATSAIRTAREQALRQALARGEFRLLFQPQVNEAGTVLGAEALLRWHPTGLPEVSPGDFIPLAEETGLIVPIGLWVLDTAVSALRQWQDNPCMCHLQLAVNVSARQFDQPEFVADVVHRLNGSGTSAARIKLEITESVVMESEQAVDKMNALRALGVRFSMDDFGTGHSSLRSLSRLPLDQLKIDQTFVARMGQHATDALIVRTTIALAQGLGLEVIAEGVETQEQRQFLQRNGCMLYQGFLYGRPMELETFEAFCASHRALDITSITAPPG